MKVKELIEYLQKYNPELEVITWKDGKPTYVTEDTIEELIDIAFFHLTTHKGE